MKYMHKNKLVPPTSTYGQGNHAPTVEEATDVFIAWLKHRNPTRELGTTPDNWSIHPYENAFTVVPSGGRRGNYMYIYAAIFVLALHNLWCRLRRLMPRLRTILGQYPGRIKRVMRFAAANPLIVEFLAQK